MDRVELSADLVTGIRDIDTQHTSMIAWTNAIAALGSSARDRALAGQAARFLVAYVAYHFAAEEYAMALTAYPRLAAHRQEHVEFRSRVATIRRFKESGPPNATPAAELHRVMVDLVGLHIRRADRDFARYCAANRDIASLRLPSPQELISFGHRLADYAEVEYVHGAGEVTVAEVKDRLKDDRRWK